MSNIPVDPVDYFGSIRNTEHRDRSSRKLEGVIERDLDALVRAVSNATRRQILRLCSGAFVSAGDVATHIDLALASVSEHLKVLRKTGLVELERDGTRWLYRTDTSRVTEVLEALSADLPTKPQMPTPAKGDTP